MNSYINIMTYYYIIFINSNNNITVVSNLYCMTLNEAQELTSKINYSSLLRMFNFILSKTETKLIQFIKNNKINIKNRIHVCKYINSNLIIPNKCNFNKIVKASNKSNKIVGSVSLKLICIKYIYERKEIFTTKINILPLELRNLFEMKFAKYKK